MKDPGPISVRGGTTGTSAAMDDMLSQAGVLARAGTDVGSVAGHAASDRLEIFHIADELSAPAEFARAEAATITAMLRLGAVVGELEALAAALATAATAYRATEQAIAGGWTLVKDNAAYAAGVSARTAAAAGTAAATAWALSPPGAMTIAASSWWATHGGPDGAKQWLENHPETMRAVSRFASHHADGISALVSEAPGFVDGLTGMPPPDAWPDLPGFPDEPPWPHDAGSLAALAVALGAPLGYLKPTGVQVSHGTGVPKPANGPTDLSGLFDRTAAQSGPRPGQIRVERVDAPGGHRYIVEIPATQDWSPRPGVLPTDLTTDVTGVAGERSAMDRAVARALARVPGLKAGDPIMLVGYSQGGITAAGLAADSSFRHKYNVQSVVSVGAPIAGFEVPENIKVLAVEHDRDVVPNLDGADNPDRPNITTVTRRLPRTGDGAAGAHSATKYARTMAMLDHAPPPAVAAWLRANRKFFGGGESTSFDYVPRRTAGATRARDGDRAGRRSTSPRN